MEISSVRHPMFDIPVWEFDLSGILTEIKGDLVDDALETLHQFPAENRPFSQSQATLAERSDAWADTISVFANITAQVLEHSYQRIDGVEPPVIEVTKSWVLKVNSAQDWDREAQRFQIIHNHPGSTLSSVLFLDGPDGDGESPGGGTMFMNPLAHVADPRLIPQAMTIPWRPLHLLLFPSWLQHGPARPDKGDRPRLTVATDYTV